MQDISIMIENIKFNYRVGLIFEYNNKILVEFNKSFDFAIIPGGRIKTLESSIEAIKREIKEELGYDLDINKIKINMIIENIFEFDNKKYHEIYFIYKTKLDLDSELYSDNVKNKESDDSYYQGIDKDKINDVHILPKVIKSHIYNDEFIHYINIDN